jgi:hypothetical protein
MRGYLISEIDSVSKTTHTLWNDTYAPNDPFTNASDSNTLKSVPRLTKPDNSVHKIIPSAAPNLG